MYEAYRESRSIYYVVEKEGVFGGCGINSLVVQMKIYANCRSFISINQLGKRIRKIFKIMFRFCKEVKYNVCYLESISFKTSHHLYKIFGFENLKDQWVILVINCDVHMTKKLQ